MFVTQTLRRNALITPDRPALICGERSTNYRELCDRVARCAGALRTFGLPRGGRVAILGLNSDRVVEMMYGTVWAGGVPQNVNVRWAIPEQAYSIDDSLAAVIAVDRHFADRVPALLEKCPHVKHVLYLDDESAPQGMQSYEEFIGQADPIEDQCGDPSDVAMINYTGGTTGLSKGVMLTHTGLLASASTALLDGLVHQGPAAMVLPMFHIGGVVMPLACFTIANTVVIMPSFSALEAIKLLEQHRVAQIAAVPTMVQMIVDHPDLATHDLSSLKYLTYGGSPISEALLLRVRQSLPNVKLFQLYGQTECMPATVLPDADHAPERGRLRSAGRPSPGCEVRVLDAAGNDQPRGAVGEVVLRGLHVMAGYWNKPDLTSTAIRGGWLYTGDAGYMDADGYLFVVDRLKDMVVTGGENVYCSEVENALASHPSVLTCSVIGIPHPQWGESIHAAVVLNPGAQTTGDELQEHCRGLIAGYKLPRSFEFRVDLPLTPVGKVNKVALRAPHWQAGGRSVA